MINFDSNIHSPNQDIIIFTLFLFILIAALLLLPCHSRLKSDRLYLSGLSCSVVAFLCSMIIFLIIVLVHIFSGASKFFLYFNTYLCIACGLSFRAGPLQFPATSPGSPCLDLLCSLIVTSPFLCTSFHRVFFQPYA